MFDFDKPTAQLLGRWQPWHPGHTALFKKAYAEIGQVCIMIRQVPKDAEANKRVPGQDDNPWTVKQVMNNIKIELEKEGFTLYKEYVIIKVPNIVDISYGRGVGYTFTEHDLGEEVHSISATKIRKELREKGKLS
ncbi:MAG: cytidyltransferase [Euryarchaeota archaeon]|jgi:nicotinamide mononucleotide adenylyltransferase